MNHEGNQGGKGALVWVGRERERAKKSEDGTGIKGRRNRTCQAGALLRATFTWISILLFSYICIFIST